MNSEFVPKITLQVEAMKGSIVHAMGLCGSDMEAYINKSVADQMSAIDYDGIIQKAMEHAVCAAINNYFTWGQGQKDVQAATDAAMQAFKDKAQEQENDRD